jgi:hypothetical protein
VADHNDHPQIPAQRQESPAVDGQAVNVPPPTLEPMTKTKPRRTAVRDWWEDAWSEGGVLHASGVPTGSLSDPLADAVASQQVDGTFWSLTRKSRRRELERREKQTRQADRRLSPHLINPHQLELFPPPARVWKRAQYIQLTQVTAVDPNGPPVSKDGLRLVFRKLGIQPRRLRIDQLLDEAHETADPVHLMGVFGISDTTALKYVRAAHPHRFGPEPTQA